MSTFELWTLILQSTLALAAFVTLILVYRQVRAMIDQIAATQEATRAQGALALANFLQSQEVREARECVRSVLSKKHHANWDEAERRHASLVCSNYDVVACLIRSNLASVELFTVNWGPSIVHCHQVLAPYIDEVRKKTGSDAKYWSNFDWLQSQVTLRR